jgi:hypothetical protein
MRIIMGNYPARMAVELRGLRIGGQLEEKTP